MSKFVKQMAHRDVLNAVDRWLDGYWMIREKSIIPEAGRFDAVLVPVTPMAHCMRTAQDKNPGTVTAPYSFWERPRLIGVEVKTSRADFLAGKNRGQFEQYGEHLSGLYIATPKGICERKELPAECGWLVTHYHGNRQRKKPICVCVRHPKYKDVAISVKVAWRLIFELRKEFVKARHARDINLHNAKEKLGHVVAMRIFAPIAKIAESIEQETT